MQWFKDALTGQPRPTNRAPGLCYMLFGATQHSNTDPSDKTSPAIPIGPHWMILWPFDPTHCGLPTTVRDAGAWIMFAGTPYAYLHICGTPLGWQRILTGRRSCMDYAVLEAPFRLGSIGRDICSHTDRCESRANRRTVHRGKDRSTSCSRLCFSARAGGQLWPCRPDLHGLAANL